MFWSISFRATRCVSTSSVIFLIPASSRRCFSLKFSEMCTYAEYLVVNSCSETTSALFPGRTAGHRPLRSRSSPSSVTIRYFPISFRARSSVINNNSCTQCNGKRPVILRVVLDQINSIINNSRLFKGGECRGFSLFSGRKVTLPRRSSFKYRIASAAT